MKTRLAVILAALTVILVATWGVYNLVVSPALNKNSLQPTFAGGAVGNVLSPTDNSFSVQVDKVEKNETAWLFHISMQRKTASSAANSANSNAVSQFALEGYAPAGTPASESALILTMPEPAFSNNHPGFHEAPEGSSDGWLEANLTQFAFKPDYLEYRYEVIHTKACKSPSDPSSCHPADLYRVLAWKL